MSLVCCHEALKRDRFLEVGAAGHYQPANSSLGFSEIDELIEWMAEALSPSRLQDIYISAFSTVNNLFFLKYHAAAPAVYIEEKFKL